MAANSITIEETDEIGTPTATYVCSSAATAGTASAVEKKKRVDLILPSTAPNFYYFQSILNVFLPVGYPQSVSDDYLEYQIYDSLQAFSSSIAGMLSSRAVLEGVGVGDSTASPTAALLYRVLQDSVGQIAQILFAHRLGTALQPECKMYRLAADVFNDSAMVLDCLSPVFPKPAKIGVLTLSGALRALCGVAAGSSKASLSAHFAKWGNIGELNAKDSSQETVISLMGMLAGTFIVSLISSRLTTWIALIILLLVHITTNYAAVRAIKMRTLNRQRSNLVFSTLLEADHVLTPEQTATHERIFERDGILRWNSLSRSVLGVCRIGVSLEELLRLSSVSQQTLGNVDLDVPKLLDIFKHENYVLWFDSVSKRGAIVLKAGATPTSQLKAWSHALIVSQYMASSTREREITHSSHERSTEKAVSTPTSPLAVLEDTLRTHSEKFPALLGRLKDAGWEVDVPSLETRPGRRLAMSKAS